MCKAVSKKFIAWLKFQVFFSIPKNSDRAHKSRLIRLFSLVNSTFVSANVQRGTRNDKQIKDARSRTLCLYKKYSQAIRRSYMGN